MITIIHKSDTNKRFAAPMKSPFGSYHKKPNVPGAVPEQNQPDVAIQTPPAPAPVPEPVAVAPVPPPVPNPVPETVPPAPSLNPTPTPVKPINIKRKKYTKDQLNDGINMLANEFTKNPSNELYQQIMSSHLNLLNGKQVNLKEFLAPIGTASNRSTDEILSDLLMKHTNDMALFDEGEQEKPFSIRLFQEMKYKDMNKDKSQYDARGVTQLKPIMVDGKLDIPDWVMAKYPSPGHQLIEEEEKRLEARRALAAYQWKVWEYGGATLPDGSPAKQDPGSIDPGRSKDSRVTNAFNAFNNTYKGVKDWWAKTHNVPGLPSLTVSPFSKDDGETTSTYKDMHRKSGNSQLLDHLEETIKLPLQKGVDPIDPATGKPRDLIKKVTWSQRSPYAIMSQVLRDAIRENEATNGALAKNLGVPDDLLRSATWQAPAKPGLPGGKYWIDTEMINPGRRHLTEGSIVKSLISKNTKKPDLQMNKQVGEEGKEIGSFLGDQNKVPLNQFNPDEDIRTRQKLNPVDPTKLVENLATGTGGKGMAQSFSLPFAERISGRFLKGIPENERQDRKRKLLELVSPYTPENSKKIIPLYRSEEGLSQLKNRWVKEEAKKQQAIMLENSPLDTLNDQEAMQAYQFAENHVNTLLPDMISRAKAMTGTMGSMKDELAKNSGNIMGIANKLYDPDYQEDKIKLDIASMLANGVGDAKGKAQNQAMMTQLLADPYFKQPIESEIDKGLLYEPKERLAETINEVTMDILQSLVEFMDKNKVAALIRQIKVARFFFINSIRKTG